MPAPKARMAHRDSKFEFDRRGVLFVLSSPSGAGKSTIARKLLEVEPGMGVSVSATTRPMREGEQDGREYHFVSTEEFKARAANHEFLEWAHVFNYRYGTPRAPVKKMLAEGQDVLFDVDWQGAQQLFQLEGGDVVRVFIVPPSLTELEKRLRDRNTDSEEVIQYRMKRAERELSHWDGYDYVVVNDDLNACFEKVHTILQAEREKRSRKPGLIGFIRERQEEAVAMGLTTR
ncbi:guanylate kinase [Sphingomonas koreensis]|jgi:guanylate kinase|uniref:Guanylate kinase n=2 Tax=Sphingomonas koreensis TaxID=93064 RepID=A0A430G1C8_9SPHN|nr:guanylate kinase [Sphingomonas koreensis]RSU18314.1 guanylate kinase [Sphingomonas koreensis]RSU28528.1 guanylate kinase [Sphingomonas koreensis]RSU31152.1 guanylate kinase [Sphingomonas koreensis]RSU31532.1 guanylate kinase [Sphingomonas koreensis]RSU35870.1 guanylate kinase [Sphingomonas koreensis]